MSKTRHRTYSVAHQRSDDLVLPRHPDAPADSEWRTWVNQLTDPLAVDLFCGAGGLSLGLEQAGCKVILAVDVDERALSTHRANFEGTAIALDLSNPKHIKSLIARLDGIDIDILAGGPPCQPFSRAGRSKIRSLVNQGSRPSHDERSELWQSFVQVAESLRPRSVLFENVPDLALGDDSTIIRHMTTRLEQAGYAVDYKLLDAWRYGVPQHRQRLVLVAILDGSYNWPYPTDLVTVRAALGDMPSLNSGTGKRTLPYDGPLTDFQVKARNQIPEGSEGTIFDHMTRPVREDDRQAFQLMDATTSYSDLPAHLRRYRSDIFTDKYNRLNWEDLSRTITAHIAKDGYWYIHPEEPRTITVREAARLQTFPDRFRFAGTRSHAFSQIGNAVPPTLAELIASSLLASMDSAGECGYPTSSTRRANSRHSLVAWHSNNKTPWISTDQPWHILISLICGQRGSRDNVAKTIIQQWPEPRIDLRTQISNLLTFLPAQHQIESKLERLAWAGKRIADHGWHDRIWPQLADLKPSEVEWVKAIGLRQKAVVPTTAALRVATRFEGEELTPTRSNKRLTLSKLVGAEPQSTEVLAALTAIGNKICRLTDPDCAACPLHGDCESAYDTQNQLKESCGR